MKQVNLAAMYPHAEGVKKMFFYVVQQWLYLVEKVLECVPAKNLVYSKNAVTSSVWVAQPEPRETGALCGSTYLIEIFGGEVSSVLPFNRIKLDGKVLEIADILQGSVNRSLQRIA